MAFPPKTSVENIEDDPASDEKGKSGPKGPPAQNPKPKSQKSPYADSLFGKAGAAQTGESSAGLGSEGSDPSIIGTQGYALVQRGIQMLNLAFPNDPGLAAVLTDIMGRLQVIIPQLVAGQSQQLNAGLFPQQGMQPPMAGPGGMPPGGGGMPPGAPPGPPAMMGGPAAPGGGGPIAPPIPSMH